MSSKITIFLLSIAISRSPLGGTVQSAHAALIPTASTLTIGGLVFTDLTNLIVLYANVSTSGANYTTPRQPNAVAGYTPSGSKNFRVWAVKAYSSDTTPNSARLLYADSASLNSAVGANPVYMGDSSNYMITVPIGGTGSGNGAGEHAWGKKGFLVLNGKYPVINHTGAASAFYTVYGYEE